MRNEERVARTVLHLHGADLVVEDGPLPGRRVQLRQAGSHLALLARVVPRRLGVGRLHAAQVHHGLSLPRLERLRLGPRRLGVGMGHGHVSMQSMAGVSLCEQVMITRPRGG
jgi:hypothetical protein